MAERAIVCVNMFVRLGVGLGVGMAVGVCDRRNK